MTQCCCNQPGWCDRHQCYKNVKYWHLCKNNEEVFQQYEKGEGPGQDIKIPLTSEQIAEIEKKKPSLLEMGENLTKAAAKHVANGMKKAPPKVQEERLSICETCPLINPNNGNPRCKKCGCFLEEKVSWASEACPLDPPLWEKHPNPSRKRGSG